MHTWRSFNLTLIRNLTSALSEHLPIDWKVRDSNRSQDKPKDFLCQPVRRPAWQFPQGWLNCCQYNVTGGDDIWSAIWPFDVKSPSRAAPSQAYIHHLHTQTHTLYLLNLPKMKWTHNKNSMLKCIKLFFLCRLWNVHIGDLDWHKSWWTRRRVLWLNALMPNMCHYMSGKATGLHYICTQIHWSSSKENNKWNKCVSKMFHPLYIHCKVVGEIGYCRSQ